MEPRFGPCVISLEFRTGRGDGDSDWRVVRTQAGEGGRGRRKVAGSLAGGNGEARARGRRRSNSVGGSGRGQVIAAPRGDREGTERRWVKERRSAGERRGLSVPSWGRGRRGSQRTEVNPGPLAIGRVTSGHSTCISWKAGERTSRRECTDMGSKPTGGAEKWTAGQVLQPPGGRRHIFMMLYINIQLSLTTPKK